MKIKADQQTVIIIPGLGDREKGIKFITNFWKKNQFDPIIFPVRWSNNENFEQKLNRLLTLIDELKNKGKVISLVGTSAGGSVAINAFIRRKKLIYKVVNICGRLKVGPTEGWRSFKSTTSHHKAFAQSILFLENNAKLLNPGNRKKIMTMTAMFGDELVPKETNSFEGAYNVSIPTFEHMTSIILSLTLFSNKIFSFLRSNNEL